MVEDVATASSSTTGSTRSRPPAALAFEGVSFAYGAAPVVRDISLRVAPGELVGLLGPNGAGKSTLLKLAAGVLRPSGGRILACGDDLRRLTRHAVAQRIAVVPQDFSVQFNYTVRQVVEMGRLPHSGPFGALGSADRLADREAVTRALDEAQAGEIAERVFNTLSGGERQRVVVALALAQDANIVLLDEPTAHLDIKHQIEVLELLRRLNHDRRLTVVAALHDLNLAARYFPRLVLFRNGIVRDGPPAQVLDGALLSEVYETPVRVGILRGEVHLSVLPPAAAGPASSAGERAQVAARVARVHVLAGGGSGELVMHALTDAGIPFGAGPLNIGDSDYTLAQTLAATCIAELPFAPVSAASLRLACERMIAAGAVICCPMPLGPGNIGLFDAVLELARGGLRVLLLEPGDGMDATDDEARLGHVGARDFSGRGAAVYRALRAAGARWIASPAEAVASVAGHWEDLTP